MKKANVEKTEESQNLIDVSIENIIHSEVPDYKDLYLRTLADMDNLRKNTTKKINDIYKMANDKLIKELLPFADSLNLAVNNENVKLDEETHSQGYEVLKMQFENILSKFGLAEINVHKEDDFDESIMNAIAIASTGNKELNNKVCDIAKKGYMLNNVVIRYADVVVYKYNN